MTMTRVYDILADLLEYPGSDWDANIHACRSLVSGANCELLTTFTEFCDGVQGLSLSSLQELYTRTFDLNPVCALDIGYHLFGENYKRGIFLANLRQTEAAYELRQQHQLPDYLPVLLRLVARLGDEELRAALIAECLIPALEKMLRTLSEGDNPYRHLMAMANAALKSEVGKYSTTVQRAYLPVLANDRRNGANPHEFTTPEFRISSCEFVDPSVAVKTNPDLF